MLKWKVPESGRERYMEEAFRTNRILCLVSAFFCIAVELFNIARVLIFSGRGLETLNNRIYFGFYLVMLVCSAAYLPVDRCRTLSLKVRHRSCLLYLCFVLFWNTCLNIYDIWSTGNPRVLQAVTMLVAFSAIVTIELPFALLNIWLNYFIFVFLSQIPLLSGEGFNYMLTALMATAICIVRSYHLYLELEQSQQLSEYDRQLSEHRSWLTREQYELISQNAGLITFQWDLRNDWIAFSDNWEEIFESTCVISGFRDYIHSSRLLTLRQKAMIVKCMEDLQKGTGYQSAELLLPTKMGERRWFKVQVVCQQSGSGENIYAVGFMNDFTEEKKRLLDLEKNAELDAFTGLLNKASIDNYGRKWMENLALKNKKLVMMILDMDDFKNINDTYGHPCGDYVLKKVADRLKTVSRKNIKAGRLGGDEFIILMEYQDQKSAIYDYANRLIMDISRIRWEDRDVLARCSIGFAVSESGWTYEKLYKCADEALYEAKNKGKNRVCEYSIY